MRNVVRKRLVREYYAKRSKDYDRQKSRTWKSGKGFGDEVFAALNESMLRFSNKLALEVGVGSGRNAIPLLEKIKIQWVGLDLSREMLELAKTKMSSFKERFDLILADGEHLPFVNRAFDTLLCMSTMHYFENQKNILQKFRDSLKEDGTLVYGDLTVNEKDYQAFFEKLERNLSKAHARYYKPSQIMTLLTKQGFHVSKMKTFAYRKTYRALMEDKGQYFCVTPETLRKFIEGATEKAKEQYALTSNEMSLFYTIITARKEKQT